MKRSREPEDDWAPSATTEQDVANGPVSKFVGLDVGEPYTSGHTPDIKCSLPGHGPGIRFSTYQDYESHYHKAHTNRCLDCRKNFPSCHILDLHIKEFHDALTELRKEKGEHIYSCFVETCHEKRKSPAERRAHLIETHKYPTNYFFAVTKAGVDHRQSMLVHRDRGRSQTKNCSNPRVEKGGKKHTVKNGTTGNTEVSNVERMAPADDEMEDSAEEPVGVPMGESNKYVSPDHEGTASTIKSNTTLPSEGDAISASRSILIMQLDQQADEKRGPATLDADMENLTGAMSSLRFIPRNVRLDSKRAGLASR